MTDILEGQMNIYDLDTLCGKTSPALSAATKERTSKLSSKRSAKLQTPVLQFLCLKRESGRKPDASWEMDTALPGASMMLNFGEFPSEERESTLSQILEANAPEKYYLSARACAGILRRAENRGKELPPMLKEALEEAVKFGA